MAPISLLTNTTLEAAQNGTIDHNLEWRANDETADLVKGLNMLLSRVTQTEDAFADEKNRLDKVLLCLTDMLFIVDTTGSINRTNNISRDTLRYDNRDIVGLPIWRLFKEGRTLILSILDKLQRTSVSHNVKTTMLAADGLEIPVLLSATFTDIGDEPTLRNLILICKCAKKKN